MLTIQSIHDILTGGIGGVGGLGMMVSSPCILLGMAILASLALRSLVKLVVPRWR